MASHKPIQVIYRKKKITLDRGEIAIAYRDLARKFKLSTRNIVSVIKNLIKSGNLKQKLHKHLSIYTIVKYSKYQDVPVKTEQKLSNRTTTNTNILYSSNDDISLSSMTGTPKKITVPTLQDLKTKIIEKPKEKNEWEIMREKLDANDYEKWVLQRLNS
jgi:hypothetical protein